MVRRLSDSSRPSDDIKNFTNREDELAVFRRVIDKPVLPLPVVAFYGVGGNGKTWLIKRLRNHILDELPKLPVAWLDFDPDTGGGVYHTNDCAAALREIRRQFNIECPRFDMADGWLRSHQGYDQQPRLRGAGTAGTVWEALREIGVALAADMPGNNVVTWLTERLGGKVWDKYRDCQTVEWLASSVGQRDYFELSRMTPQEIYPLLSCRLLLDLKEHLPANFAERACRGVVFLDTFERLEAGLQAEAQRHDREKWVRELFAPDSPILMVVCGRDWLRWQEADPDFSNREYLEQHLVGGLSEQDARQFLANCGTRDQSLQDAILRVSVEEQPSPQTGYHPFSLGLCVDTVLTNERQGRKTEPSTFDLNPGDKRQLAVRFLRSLRQRSHEGVGIVRLSYPPRFDEQAARDAFSDAAGAEQDAAWAELRDYSFVRESQQPGWLMLHSQMRGALRSLREDSSSERHQWWKNHWERRAMEPHDQFAELAWYHQWCLDEQEALRTWTTLCEQAREQLNMGLHFDLLSWWALTEIPSIVANSETPNPTQARILFFRGFEYEKASIGDRSQNLQHAITSYDAAQHVCTQSDFPQQSAQIKINLGNAYCNLPSGDRTEHLQQAIACYEDARQVYTQEDFPLEWAGTEHNLGTAYSDLPSGDRSANLQRAIACYEAALQVRTEDEFPQDWAATQGNLGIAYAELLSGDRLVNLQKAISSYEASLRVYTENTSPQGWALVQNSIANAYTQLPRGDRLANLQKAIKCFKAALRVYTEDNFPQDWAMIQNNLGVAYSDLPGGDEAENIRRAIACYEAALVVRTEDDFPEDWAATQNNLGEAYIKLPGVDRAENLQRSIARYTAALRFYTEENTPLAWANTQLNLGYAYSDLTDGDREENVTQAIICYKAALRVYTEDDFPEKFAMTQNNMAYAYGGLPTDHNGQNVKQEIACYAVALRVYNEIDFPEEWARTQCNQGIAHSELSCGDREVNLRRAIACYEGALRVLTKDEYPMDWAMMQNNVAEAYQELPSGNRRENLQQAIACFRSALCVYTEDNFPEDWAKTQQNLESAESLLAELEQ